MASNTPNASQSLALAPGWYSYRGWVKSTRGGANRASSGLRISLKGSGTTDLFRGTHPWSVLERRDVVVLPGDTPRLRIEAYQKPSGDYFIDDLTLRRLTPPGIEGFLLYPNFRGALFEDRSQTIRVQVTVRPEELRLTLAELVVRLSLATADGSVVTSTQSAAPAQPAVLSLDAAGAPLGRLRLHVQALRLADGVVVAEYPPYAIVKLAAGMRDGLEAYVDPDNVMVLDGRRRFVLGIYDTTGFSSDPAFYEPRISKIAEAPLDLYLNYWLGSAPNDALSALGATLTRYGMSYLHTVNRWYEGRPGWSALPDCEDGTSPSDGEEAYTSCRAQELSSIPGIAGWYTADERPADQAARVFGQYRILRAQDSGSVTFIAQNDVRELSRWRDVADVFDAHSYPIYNVPEGVLSPLESVFEKTMEAQAVLARSRPTWTVIQFFKRTSQGHFPTYEELRTMSYMAIVAGAKGLFYWSYGALGLASVPDPELREVYWQRLVRLTNEIKSLEPALLSPDSPQVLTDFSPVDVVRVLAKTVGGARYLIAVNITAQSRIRATFTLARTPGAIHVIGESRVVGAAGRTFTDTFAPYQTHIYRIGAP